MGKTADAFCARCGERVRARTVVVTAGVGRLALAVGLALVIGWVVGRCIARWGR